MKAKNYKHAADLDAMCTQQGKTVSSEISQQQ